MLDIGKLILMKHLFSQIPSFSSMLDIGKLIPRNHSFQMRACFSSMLDIGKLIQTAFGDQPKADIFKKSPFGRGFFDGLFSVLV